MQKDPFIASSEIPSKAINVMLKRSVFAIAYEALNLSGLST